MLRMYLLHFRYLLKENGLSKLFFDAINRVMSLRDIIRGQILPLVFAEPVAALRKTGFIQ